MAKLKSYLDKRSLNNQGEAPLKISISHRNTTALMSLGVYIKPDDWDSDSRIVIKHPRRRLYNSFIAKRIADMEAYIITQRMQNVPLGRTATELKNHLLSVFAPEPYDTEASDEEARPRTYTAYFEEVAERKRGNTKHTYKHTLGRIRAFDARADKRSFEDINKAWLERFGLWLSEHGSSTNTIAIHYRNMRAVFNDAIDNEVSTAYPFRRFHIKTERTRKRSLTATELRTLFSAEVDETEKKYLDMFKLIFFLMGINLVDLAQLKEITSEGRIEFNRAKTKRFYSMKVEPEALELIERYRGERWLVDILDRYRDHTDYRKRMNKALQRLGATSVGKQGRKTYRPLFPELTTYWARHTWATIAASLDIPKETIAQALGHGGNSVTDIYIDFDRRKIDEANRKVIDYVLGLD